MNWDGPKTPNTRAGKTVLRRPQFKSWGVMSICIFCDSISSSFGSHWFMSLWAFLGSHVDLAMFFRKFPILTTEQKTSVCQLWNALHVQERISGLCAFYSALNIYGAAWHSGIDFLMKMQTYSWKCHLCFALDAFLSFLFRFPSNGLAREMAQI